MVVVAHEVVLKETAVVRVGDARVGCGNLWERAFVRADGATVVGMSARVSVGDHAVIVGVGSELDIDGARYVVAAIDKPAGKLGRVSLRLVP